MSSDSILVISKCKIIVTLIIFSLIVVIIIKAIVRPFAVPYKCWLRQFISIK